MSGRNTIVELLAAALDDKCKIIGDVRDLGELDAKYDWVLQLFRVGVKPAGRLSGYLEEYEVWVIDPRKETDDMLENSLDTHLDDVLLALLPHPWLTFDDARRRTHPSSYHAYKLTLTAVTKVTQEQE